MMGEVLATEGPCSGSLAIHHERLFATGWKLAVRHIATAFQCTET